MTIHTTSSCVPTNAIRLGIITTLVLFALLVACAEATLDLPDAGFSNQTPNDTGAPGADTDANAPPLDTGTDTPFDPPDTTEGCTSHADCDPLVCDPETGECLFCTLEAGCPAGQICQEQLQACLDCFLHTDCPSTHFCNDDHLCVECRSDDDCDEGTFCTDEDNICVQCSHDDHCDAGICDLALNECTGCTHHDHCPDGFCDTDQERCVECLGAAHCPGGVCHEGLCHQQECIVDSHCPGSDTCTPDNTCASSCVSNAGCPVIGEVCGPANTCIRNPNTNSCSADGDCPYNSCGTIENRCHCLIDAHCSPGQSCHGHLFGYDYCA